MPIRNYICQKCGHEFEYLHLSKDEPAFCPKCGSIILLPYIGLSNFQLKGPGWYKDGYTKEKK